MVHASAVALVLAGTATLAGAVWARTEASRQTTGSAQTAPQGAARPAGVQASRRPATQSNVTVDSNPQLFATMCALEAAGFEKDVSSAGFHPLRAQLRGELVRQRGPAVEALRAYFEQHRFSDPAATLSRFISFALLAGPPPNFAYTLRHDDLPPDVLAIEDFNDVLAAYYREQQIDRLWARVEPQYDREIERLHAPVSEMVYTTTGYLRELLKPASARTFAVYVEPLIGARTNFRSYGSHYALVLSPSGELPVDEIRHALLHFLLDPLAQRYAGAVEAKRPLYKLAQRAPRLPREYKDDLTAYVTECLVHAVELEMDTRLRHAPPAKLAMAIDQADAEGLVLVRPMVRELGKFEKAEPAMSFYFPDLMHGIVVADEAKRLQGVTFAAAAPPAVTSADGSNAPGTSGSSGTTSAGGEEPELAATLDEGDRQIAAHDAAGATATFQQVLAKYPEQPRALYGLAVASVLQGEVDQAKDLFQRVVAEPAVDAGAATAAKKDPLIVAWSHVYLGRIYDVGGERELAVSEYRAALAVPGAPETALQAARRGMEKGYERGTRNP